MLILVLAAILFFWLVLGAFQFLICFTTPRLRRYSLSAALWWAVIGPCSIALLLLGGLVMVAHHAFVQDGHFGRFHLPAIPVGFGWGYLILGGAVCMAIATSIAWLHQVIVQRFTFALFRLYATAVSAGIASVFGWCIGFWIMGFNWNYGWALGAIEMLTFVVGFGFVAYRGARSLRGDAPTTLAWISPEEFEGV